MIKSSTHSTQTFEHWYISVTLALPAGFVSFFPFFVLVHSLIITLQRFLEKEKIKIIFIWSAKPSLNVWSSCYFLNIFTTDPLNLSHFYWLILDYYFLRKLPIQQSYWVILDYYLLRKLPIQQWKISLWTISTNKV